MKAIVYTQFGSPDVLHLEEIAKPSPKDHEVLIRNYASTINFGDLIARHFNDVSPRRFSMPFFFWLPARLAFGLSKPRIPVLGSEFAGEIEEVGKAVTRYQPGDQVFGYLGQNMGAYTEYICLPEDGVMAIKPAHMTYEEAAVMPYGAIMAWSLLRRVNLQPGQSILIIGASGGIGSAAVQIAKDCGANVTGVCSTPRLGFVKSLGADQVIDYTREDFTQNGKIYDLIFDVLGKSSFSRCRKSLKQNGRYLLASFKTKQLLQMVWTSLSGSQKVVCAMAPGSVEDLNSVKALMETGKLKAVIDRCFLMDQAAAAHRYVEEGHKKANVVITIR